MITWEASLLKRWLVVLLLMLQSLREIEEALTIFVTYRLLSMCCHLVPYSYLALVWSLNVHLLRQELNFLLMEIAWAYQLSPVDSLLIIWNISSCLALNCATCWCLWLKLVPLISSLEQNWPCLWLVSFHHHSLLIELWANQISLAQVRWNLRPSTYLSHLLASDCLAFSQFIGPWRILGCMLLGLIWEHLISNSVAWIQMLLVA